jgi:hypothetical protein
VIDGGLSDAERIAICQATIQALNRRDLESYFSHMHADYAIRTDPSWEGGPVLAERAALSRFLGETFEYWPELEYEFLKGPEVIGERVVTRDRWRGRRAGEEEWTNLAVYWAAREFAQAR